MKIRERIDRLLSRGDRTDGGTGFVEVAVIPLGMGPMMVESLRLAGFDAKGSPAFNVVTEVASDYRILVPRQQAAAATACLDELL